MGEGQAHESAGVRRARRWSAVVGSIRSYRVSAPREFHRGESSTDHHRSPQHGKCQLEVVSEEADSSGRSLASSCWQSGRERARNRFARKLKYRFSRILSAARAGRSGARTQFPAASSCAGCRREHSLLWATEGRFGIDHPVLTVQPSQKSTELFWISQRGGWSGAA